MQRLLLSALVAFGALATTLSTAAVRIEADLDRHTEPNESTKRTQRDEHRSLVVTLSATAIVVDDEQGRSVDDFEKRRKVVVDRRTNTRVDYSMYAMPALRIYEFQNRVLMHRGLANAKITLPGAMSTIDDEHALSIQDTPSNPLKESADATYRTFTDGDRVFFRETLHATALPPAEARRFAQFVRNVAGGHPQIIGHLADANAVPDEWVMTSYQTGTTTTTLRVRSVRTVVDAPTDVASYAARQTPADGDAIDRLLDRGMNLSAAELDAERRLNAETSARASSPKAGYSTASSA